MTDPKLGVHVLPNGAVFDPIPDFIRNGAPPVKKPLDGAEFAEKQPFAVEVPLGKPIPAVTFTSDGISSWAEVNPHAFKHYLETEADLTPGTMKTYYNGFNRIKKSISLREAHDPRVLQAFRCSLPIGTRNIVDASWAHLVKFMVGYAVTLPTTLPSRPRIRFTHPLYPDMVTVTATIVNHRLPEVTWRSLARWTGDDMMVSKACQRICEFQTGERLGLPVPDALLDTAIVPGDAVREPMAPWRVEWIVNSAADTTDGVMELESERFFSQLAHIGVPGYDLREFAALYVRARSHVARHRDAKKTMREIHARTHPMRLSELRRLLEDLAGDDGTVNVPLW